MPPQIPVQRRPATRQVLERLRHGDQQPHVIASAPNDDWHWESEPALTSQIRLELFR